MWRRRLGVSAKARYNPARSVDIETSPSDEPDLPPELEPEPEPLEPGDGSTEADPSAAPARLAAYLNQP